IAKADNRTPRPKGHIAKPPYRNALHCRGALPPIEVPAISAIGEIAKSCHPSLVGVTIPAVSSN
ncbi:MAG: hypothetical protein OXF56_19500, partial [Rhodobacteraceae bacterium]|nr:hypothetical protein [Paracoccaceae bacterium]